MCNVRFPLLTLPHREIDFLLAHSDPTTPRDDQDHEVRSAEERNNDLRGRASLISLALRLALLAALLTPSQNEVHGTEGLFVEPPLLRPSFSKPRDFLENHLIEVTDKAFVTFKTYTAATIAAQSMHGSKPSYFKVSQAPEPRAILWENIHVTTKAERARHILGNMFVLILIGKEHEGYQRTLFSDASLAANRLFRSSQAAMPSRRLSSPSSSARRPSSASAPSSPSS